MSFRHSPSGLLVPDFNIQVPKIIPRGHNLRRLMKEDYGTLVGAKPPTATYTDKAMGYSPVAYWRFEEESGTNADNYEGTAAGDGTYQNTPTLNQTGIGDGLGAPLFEPANTEWVDIPDGSNWNWDGAEGMYLGWFKAVDSGVWTDSAVRFFIKINYNSQNFIRISRNSNDNRIDFYREGGNVQERINVTGVGQGTNWFTLAMRWSEAGDYVEVYVNGVSKGTNSGLGTWTGDPAGNYICSEGGLTMWDGYAAHQMIFDNPHSDAVVTDLQTVP